MYISKPLYIILVLIHSQVQLFWTNQFLVTFWHGFQLKRPLNIRDSKFNLIIRYNKELCKNHLAFQLHAIANDSFSHFPEQ